MDKTKQNFKGVCRYAEGCYRVNPTHLKEYEHPHLGAIIKNSKDGKYKFPKDFSVPKEIALKQIELLKAGGIYSASQTDDHSTSSEIIGTPPKKQKLDIKLDQRTNTPESSSTRKAHTTNTLRTPSSTKVETSLRDQTPNSIHNENPAKRVVTKNDLANALKNINPSLNKPSNSTRPDQDNANNDRNIGNNSKPSTSSSSTSQSKPENQTNRPRIEDFFAVVAPKGQMAMKLKNAEPYNIFYTTITSAPLTHPTSDPLSITFQELLDASLGQLESSLQINFMIDIGWLLGHYYFSGNITKPMLILYGDDTPEIKNINSKKPNVTSIRIEMNGAFGTHHTKMMIFSYTDNSVRVVISTANLYEDDWHNRTQGLWISPKCPQLPESADTAAGESPTAFKESLLRYLQAYKLGKLMTWIVKVRKCDFSAVNVFLVASVPGGHVSSSKGPMWGHPRLGYLLEKNSSFIEDISPVVVQSSSIGSLGPNVNSWILDEFVISLRKDKSPGGLRRVPDFKMIYPSLSNVLNSHDGILGGGCLPYGKVTNNKQPWLKNYLYQWKAKCRNRDRAMPHIKTYCRWLNDKLPWFCLTSANLSKAAWGVYNKVAKLERPLRIMNYEAGVLFIPKFVTGQDYFSLKNFPMPYDIPLKKYGIDDVPFVADAC